MKQQRRKSRRGQAMSEYLILIALISVGSMAVVQILSRNLQGKLAQVANHLGGYSDTKIKGVKAGEEVYRVRDLGDFGSAIKNSGD